MIVCPDDDCFEVFCGSSECVDAKLALVVCMLLVRSVFLCVFAEFFVCGAKVLDCFLSTRVELGVHACTQSGGVFKN